MMDQKTQMREGFEAQRKAGMNVDWFTWQIAWHDALFTVHDIAGDAALARQPAAIDRQEAERYRYLRNAVGVILDCSHAGPWKFGSNIDVVVDEWLAQKAARTSAPHPANEASKPASPSVEQDERAAIRRVALKDAENIARLFDLGTPDGHAIADDIRKLADAELAVFPQPVAQTERVPLPMGIPQSEGVHEGVGAERPLTDDAGKRLPSEQEIQSLRDHGHGEEAAYWEEAIRNEALKRGKS